VAATLVGHVADWFDFPHAPFVVSAVLYRRWAPVDQGTHAGSALHAAEAVLVAEEF
jgi:hypothetical protein